ncbi:hypothetical protein B0H17DRAFT_929398 [Mycena rosella]|uniref:Uncharacterized protein n=1 Tax=Mycena rosella TaxID=1033263 RepID=A0AAD7DP56_MYCRO|nr:hypothetical protein B0H17DRAFT_929398 [Mycena rosella]
MVRQSRLRRNIRSPDFLTQIPQPMHRNSEMKAILSVDLTSMHKTYRLSSAHVFRRTFLHSCAHRFGLHLFASTMAIRVILSAMAVETRKGELCCQRGTGNWRGKQDFAL